jgi:hypothetical protein
VQFSPTPQTGTANPFGEPQSTNITINPLTPPSGIPATLNSGDNVIAVYLTQNSQGSSDAVFGMSLHGSQCIPITVQHPPVSGTNVNVVQCRNVTLTVQASGLPSPFYQWSYNGGPVGNGPSLTVNNVQAGVNDGVYTVQMTNTCSTVSRTFTISVTPDATAPVLLFAEVNATRTQISTIWSEPLKAVDSGNDEFLLLVQENPSAPTLNDFGQGLTLVNQTNLLIPLTAGAWVEGTAYRLFDSGGGAEDACTELDSAAGDIAISVPSVFRDGLNGYTGTEDVELRSAEPDNTALGTSATDLQIDNDPISHYLLQFRNIFGSGPGQVPVNATILRATLTLNQTDPGSAVDVHRMLIDWTESATYNSMGTGVQADDVEAAAVREFQIPNAANALRTFDVTASIALWVTNPSANHGWAFRSTGTDGMRGSVSENATEANRPTLQVSFIETPACVGIHTQPPATINIGERDPLNISLVVTGSSVRFFWQKETSPGVFTDISGANSGSYSKASALPADSGRYRV